MKSFRIVAGFMVVLLVTFMSLSAVAYAKRGDDDDSGSGHKKNTKGRKFQVLQTQIDANRNR